MALFKIFKGNDTAKLINSNATGYLTPTDGYAYYDTSSKLFYIDAEYPVLNNGEATGAIELRREPINAAKAGIAGTALNGIFYGVCNTAQGTKAKVAIIEDSLGFVLQIGTIVVIKFSNASAASTMTLTLQNKNNKTIGAAHNLELYGTTAMSSGTTTNGWRAGAVVPFVYDGTNWIRFFWENSTYYYTSAYCTTSAATADKVGAYSGVQTLTGSKYFQIWIQNTNTAASTLTLNMNSLGAKKIYLNGEPTSSTNYNLLRGCYLVYYDIDGDNGNGCYHFRTDNKISGNLAGNADTATKLSNTPNTTTTYLRGDNSWQTLISSGTSTLAWNNEVTLATVGRTAIKAKLPSNPNTDYRVRQTNDTSNTNYRLLLSNSANSTQEDNITHKNDNLTYNPSTMTLSTGNLNLTGELDVVGNAYLHNETQADSLTAGSLLVTGNANFTQIPTAPTPASGSNDASIATTAFVMNAFTANDAMVFKGVVNKNADLPATHKQGWTYKVGTAGQYAGVNCEVGDTIYCVTDGTSANNAHWAVVQANVDVPLYKDGNTFAGSKVLMSDGTGGKVKEGTIATQTVIKTATLSQGTLPTLGTAIAADDITAWNAGSTPTLGTAFSVPNVTGNTSVTASKVTKTDVTVVTNISQAASTSSVIATVVDGVLTISQAITAVGAVTKSTGTANTVSISDVSASKVTLGTAFSIPNVTDVGSKPSLSYTARTIPNVTGIGTLPSLSTTTQSVVIGIS